MLIPLMVRVPGDSVPRRLVNAAIDVLNAVASRDALLPPFSMRRFVGEARWDIWGNDFATTGQHFIEKLVADANLNPASRVLDIGSGCGRLAIPLTQILRKGSYVGLELSAALVRWCQRHISTRFPNFEFVHADLQNDLYNPGGSTRADEFAFPFASHSFTLVAALSVFTHLPQRAAENYAAECARVLAPGGMLFASFFLPENGTRSPDGGLNFAHRLSEVSLTATPHVPEQAIAYNAEWLREVFGRGGLQVQEPIRWGNWTGRADCYSGQDVLIFRKSEGRPEV
jgi:SAM-dependent methyltransferase